ncbi:hypothetical protein VTN00DRAFT_1337 [Thermoascus crustaceus]|uniref:uncharacterized protein n=1 Tax=Thermoascus crustaceus TaxID=5088 RepID=UPI00374330BF
MSSATASGADTGSARSRNHNPGNQDRKYTPEQKAAVIRVRKCSPTAFYEILALEKTASDSEIKKAYRKLSLLTHPDKNGCEGADEAFKMVSRAFQVLSDPDKKAKYDKFGVDPDSRFASAGASSASSPFSGFSGGFPRSPNASSAGGAHVFEEEISPEELFNRFFNGGLGGGFSPFGGPQFVFNMGGGPGFRVHQFGGTRPRRRPREANTRSEPTPSGWATLQQLLPLILLFVLPLISSLFSGGSSTPSGPTYRFDAPVSPHVMQRTTPKLKVNYFLNPTDVEDYTPKKFYQLDQRVEVDYVTKLRYECESEVQTRDRMVHEAQGWFFPDVEKMKEARAMELKSCKRLDALKGRASS